MPTFPRTIAIAALLLLSGCGGSDDNADAFANSDHILKYIPADTPYVLASAEGMPADVVEKIKPVYTLSLNVLHQTLLDTADAAARQMAAEGQDEEQIEATLEETRKFAVLLSPETWAESGFSMDRRGAFYGVGLVPVMRIEASDEKKARALLDRINDQSDGALTTASIDGVTYSYAGDDTTRVILAVHDGYAIISIVPASLSDDALKSVLGLTLPEQNIAAAGTLAAVASEYDFVPYMAGFVDTGRVADAFIDPHSGIDSELFEIAGRDAEGLSDICKQEIRDFAGTMPRIVVGYNELSTERITANVVFELRDDIAAGLAALATPVPGLGVDQGGLFSIGLGLDLLEARRFYEARLDALAADPFRCELFADLQAGIAGGRAALEAPLPPVVYSIKGFLAVVDAVEGMDLAAEQPPTSVDMSVVVATDNAAGLIGMGALFSPELAAMNVQPDGKPVAVALPPMGQPFDSAQVAMTDAALGLSVGRDAQARIGSLVVAAGADPSPVMSMHMEMGDYYAMIGDMQGMIAQQNPDEAMTAAQMRALNEMTDTIAALFGRASFDIVFSTRGIEMPSTVALK